MPHQTGRFILRFYLAVALIVAGCSKSPESGATNGKRSSAGPSAGRQINAYMYSDYIDPRIPEQFEARTGIKVRIDVYEATEEMMAKLQQAGGAGQYDMVVVSDHAIPVLVKQGLLQPLNREKIPNATNLSKQFVNPAYDPGNRYSLPYQWGIMGLIYRKDRIKDVDPSWAMIFDAARQPGPFVLLDSMRDLFAAALKYQGRSINTRKPDEIQAAGELILQAKKSPKLLGFDGGVGGVNKVVSDSAALAFAYNGDALRAIKENEGLGFLVPREGTLVWVDAMTIPAKAPNPDGACRFIDYILDAEVGAQLSNFNSFATPNAASMPKINPADRANPMIYPPDDLLNKMEYLEDVGNATRLYDEAWTAVKSR